ncbi:MAG: hypothetical protein AMJ56_03140, partial [Anaerolineae bacterium SG8_19]
QAFIIDKINNMFITYRFTQSSRRIIGDLKIVSFLMSHYHHRTLLLNYKSARRVLGNNQPDSMNTLLSREQWAKQRTGEIKLRLRLTGSKSE